MTIIRNRIFHGSIARETPSPGFLSNFVGRDEVLEFDGFDLVPETSARASEIGYPRFGADSSASEYDDLLRYVDHQAELL